MLAVASIWAFSLPARAQSDETVARIVVEGIQRIEANTVRSYLLIQEGDPFDPGRIDRSLKSLFATGLFADVTINQVGDALVVRVVENPVINRIAFEGNRRLDDETLEAEISLRPRVIFTRTKVQSDVRRILTLYRRGGRFAATVDPKVIQLPQNRVDVVFEIDEGDVTTVESIRFVGNKRFGDSRLREVIRTRESRWWRFLSTEDTYDPDRLAFDRELLRRFYLSKGYADFRVDSALAELTPDRRSFYITFTVEEGDRYRFGDVDIETTLRDLDPARVRSSMEIDSGDWYNADAVEKAIDGLNAAVGDLGYAFVDVRPRIDRDREARKVNVTFEVNEGPRVFVERIDISGNVRTLDEVIRREFRLVEGDAFNAAKVQRSRRRLQDLDYFERVDIEEIPGTTPDKVVIRTSVEEKSTGSLSIGAGFSTSSGFLGDFSIRERNLLGRGQDVRLGVLVGQKNQQADVSFTEPYFLGREIAAGFDIFHTRVDRQSESSFDTQDTGAALRASYPVTEDLRQSWRYSFKQAQIKDVPNDASPFVKETEGTTYPSVLSHTLTYDVRDSRINPSEGYVASFTTDFAGIGGDVRYLRHRLDGSYFYPVADKWVLKVGGSVGNVIGIFGDDVELLDRFFIGGDDLRGFATDGVGPRDVTTDDALGGEFFYTGTVQLSFPFFGLPDELGIRSRIFSDFGSAWKLQPSGPTVEDPASIRISVGAGITWVSPFGPIGIDLGFPVKKESFDDTEMLRINFGTSF
ncbi:MAG: outer membrane protein assembly factor BamA [Rhodospirillales bacterium]